MDDAPEQRTDSDDAEAVRASRVVVAAGGRVSCRLAFFSPRLDIDRYKVDERNRIIRLETSAPPSAGCSAGGAGHGARPRRLRAVRE